jgi:tetratricopeptide (TPR) repeat protein
MQRLIRTVACCALLFVGAIHLHSSPSPANPLQQMDASASGTPEARELFNTGRIAMEQGLPRQALDSFEAAIKKDPNFALAWSAAGTVHFNLRDHEQGIEEMRRAIALAPKVPQFYKWLAAALMTVKRPADALKVWEQMQQVFPDDPDARKNIALILEELGRYQEALPALEAAMNDPDGWKLLIELGTTYAELGQNEKAVAALDQALQHDSGPDALNAVAYTLSEKNLMLGQALQYAQRAVRERENETSHISLEHLTYDDLRTMPGLGGDWDTLGWAYFKMGQFAQAQTYLEAAWNLFDSATIGEHLGELFEKQGRKTEAAQVYALALAHKDVPDDLRARLIALVGSPEAADQAIQQAIERLAEMHRVKVEQVVQASGRAEFFVLLIRGPRVADVKFISGVQAFRDAANAVAAGKFEILDPDDAPIQIVRRGVLICKPEAPACDFDLLPVDSVQSVE